VLVGRVELVELVEPPVMVEPVARRALPAIRVTKAGTVTKTIVLPGELSVAVLVETGYMQKVVKAPVLVEVEVEGARVCPTPAATAFKPTGMVR